MTWTMFRHLFNGNREWWCFGSNYIIVAGKKTIFRGLQVGSNSSGSIGWYWHGLGHFECNMCGWYVNFCFNVYNHLICHRILLNILKICQNNTLHHHFKKDFDISINPENIWKGMTQSSHAQIFGKTLGWLPQSWE